MLRALPSFVVVLALGAMTLLAPACAGHGGSAGFDDDAGTPAAVGPGTPTGQLGGDAGGFWQRFVVVLHHQPP